jgi:hypothetical protein
VPDFRKKIQHAAEADNYLKHAAKIRLQSRSFSIFANNLVKETIRYRSILRNSYQNSSKLHCKDWLPIKEQTSKPLKNPKTGTNKWKSGTTEKEAPDS